MLSEECLIPQEALEDMRRAEESGYPIELRHKLLTRRCQCHIFMGNKDQAKLSLDMCKKHFQDVPPAAKGN